MKKKDFKSFQSSFLAKEDLSGPRILTIESVEEGELQGDGGKEFKPIMHFRNFEKSMVINNVNFDTIADAYGEETDDWHGKPIEVYVDPSIQFGGKKVGGVRVRLPNGRAVNPVQSFEGGDGSESQRARTEPVWDLTQAITEAGKVGITKPDLIGKLKAMGKTGYSPATDTALVQKWIAEASAPKETGFADLPDAGTAFTEDSIPF